MWQELFRAVCLMLVIEGILPFVYPGRWRQMVVTLAIVDDKKLRIMGLVSMIIGVALLTLTR